MNRRFTDLADLISEKHPNFALFLGESQKRENYYRAPLGACLTQTCVRQSDLGATKHTPMVRHPLVLLNPAINTKFSCGKCEKLMVVQQLVPGTKTGSFTLLCFGLSCCGALCFSVLLLLHLCCFGSIHYHLVYATYEVLGSLWIKCRERRS